MEPKINFTPNSILTDVEMNKLLQKYHISQSAGAVSGEDTAENMVPSKQLLNNVTADLMAEINDKAKLIDLAWARDFLQNQINDRVTNGSFNSSVSNLQNQINDRVTNGSFNSSISDLRNQINNAKLTNISNTVITTNSQRYFSQINNYNFICIAFRFYNLYTTGIFYVHSGENIYGISANSEDCKSVYGALVKINKSGYLTITRMGYFSGAHSWNERGSTGANDYTIQGLWGIKSV